MNIEEKYDKKQKEWSHWSINKAQRYMKEIGDKYIKPYLTQEEKIWDIQDGVDTLIHGSV